MSPTYGNRHQRKRLWKRDFKQTDNLTSASIVSELASQVPNIERLGVGYDIYIGNPDNASPAGQLDPGYKLTPVIDLVYKAATPSSVTVENLMVTHYSQCQLAPDVKSIHDVDEYRYFLDSLAVASSSSKNFGARFNASSNYEMVAALTNNYDQQFYHISTSCPSYTAYFPSNTPLQLSDVFKSYVNTLDKSNVDDFVRKFGTHFVKNVTMGGRYAARDVFKPSDVVDFVFNDYDMHEIATLSFEQGMKARGASTVSSKEVTLYQSERTLNVTYYLGEKPRLVNEHFDPQEWFKSVQQNPQPIMYELEPLTSLLNAGNFPHDSLITTKEARVANAINNYCIKLNLKYCSTTVPPGPLPTRLLAEKQKKKTSPLGNPYVHLYWEPQQMTKAYRGIATMFICGDNNKETFDSVAGDLILINIFDDTHTTDLVHDLIRPANWTLLRNNSEGAWYRPVCDDGFFSVGDWLATCPANKCSPTPSNSDHSLPCIAERCLKQCKPTPCSRYPEEIMISDGIRQFGADGDHAKTSFFRLQTQGQNVEDERLYKCLTTTCFENY